MEKIRRKKKNKLKFNESLFWKIYIEMYFLYKIT